MATTAFYDQLMNLELGLEKFAYSLTLEKAQAKDLVQDTFLKALINQDKFSQPLNFKAWTFTIMKNTFINNYRRGIRQKTYCEQAKESLIVNQVKAAGSDDPDSTYAEMELTQCIEQLREIFRIPFKMFISGYKYKEIAEALNLKVGTVKSRIFLSRKQLMDQLNDELAV